MKKISYLILSLAVAFVLIAGVALAAWRLETAESVNTTLDSKRDDIFENYNIKKANESLTNTVNTYEIYLYPSTLYLNEYLNSLDNKSGSVLPEDKYGYIEPVSENGKVKYNVVSKNGGDAGYLNEVSKNTSYTMSDKSFVTGMYYNVYKDDTAWSATENNGLSGNVTVGNVTLPANTKCLYGDPEADKTAVTYNDSTTEVYLQDSTGERHNWRNLHYYDRFGYWPTLAKDAGRYLPIKITVDENFSNNKFNDMVITPFADMGDPHDWFVYSFSCWAYVDNTQSPYVAPYYARSDFAANNSSTLYVNSDGTANPSLGAFCPTTVSQYFDIIKSFETYADDDNVIRLFPKFSNGKGYNAKNVTNGGGDAIKAVPAYKDESGNKADPTLKDRREIYMFYATETFSLTNKIDVHVSVLPNIAIDDYYSLDCYVAITETPAGWPGGWTSVYSLTRGEGDGKNKTLTEMLSSYGYGMYNLYLFATQVAAGTSTTSYLTELETLRQNLVYKDSSVKDSSFYGKNLLPVASVYTGGKSFMLVAEKVREAKFIGDVNFTDDKTKASNSNFTTDEQARDKYLTTDKSFRLINKNLYGYKGETKTQVNDQFPYCYILQNVDFTEATTQYCQVRFQRYYRADLHFADLTEYQYSQVEFSGTRYERGFGNYFTLVNAEVYSSENKTTSTQQVIQLKNEEMRGIYDIIIVFRSAKQADKDSPYAYNIGLYAYRHTNIFLKVYEDDPTGTISYYQGPDGATGTGSGTEYKFVDHSATPLFVKSYPIGVSITPADKSDMGGNTLAKCVNDAVDAKSLNPESVKLYDHVTRAEVAHYERTDGAGDDTLLYSGQYYKLVFNPFKIRKNYIFFISAS